ncbi:hypothetical protein M2323_001688 [Rhodoblastus acidophilus]|uniref:hypothetical protein n=1 Tax=Rhodoblastus acidophilus TaxID=1074 RepID=UPI0022241B6E|nr:hypothetical protein [Rhodoblastus acidophilus]MCW2284075.1 hypothetical protein [Rhodoblastus acidophilus]MCW2332771.1 hypothetical protein [Rhodoblastus acidophilus]
MGFRHLALLTLLAATTPAFAGDDDQNLALGRKLMAENGCNGECHASRAPDGDPAKFFSRPNLKVTSLDGLKRQVARCVGAAGARLDPGEIAAIVAALNADHYKFK